jgi:hypothetical protein
MKKISLLTILSLVSVLNADNIPINIENAQPGECYAKSIIPAQYETITEQVLKKEASETLRTIPAKYSYREEQILVRPESKRISIVPATFKTIKDNVVIRDAETFWKKDIHGDVYISEEILTAAKNGGADIENLKSGECVREYFTPPKYTTEKKNYVSREGHLKFNIQPAKYETVTEKILVKEASSRTIVIPAKYKYVSEKVEVEPEKSMWKKSSCKGSSDCGVMCYVTIPARYKTISKRVITTPASTKEIEIPAVYKTITKQRLVTNTEAIESRTNDVISSYSKYIKEKEPEFSWFKVGSSIQQGFKYTGHQICKIEKPEQHKSIFRVIEDTPSMTKETVIPAVFKTIRVKTLATPASVERTNMPEEYQTITKRVMTSPSNVVWKKVICQGNIKKPTMITIQQKLQNLGYYNGPIDGIYGSQTKKAIKSYQKDNGLAIGGLTNEFIDSIK